MVAGIEVVLEGEDTPYQWVIYTAMNLISAMTNIGENSRLRDTYVHANVI